MVNSQIVREYFYCYSLLTIHYYLFLPEKYPYGHTCKIKVGA